MRRLLAPSLILAATLAAASAQAATPKDALVMAWNLDALISLDPAQIAEVNGNDIMINVCNRLVQPNIKDVARIEPQLAESWSSSEDGLTLTFKMRKDIKFPSGKPATAQDAAWSLKRALHLNFGNAANLREWGFSAEKADQQIIAVDDHTLQLKLDRPYPTGLLLSSVFSSNVASVLNKETGEKNAKTVDGKNDHGNAWFKTQSDCVGPYRLRTWNANDVVILEANDTYFGKKPGLRRVLIRHIPESAAERLALEKGDVDVARLLNSDDLKGLEANKDVHIEQTLMHGYTYLAFNASDPILSNPKVRLAFRYLIDYEALGKTIMAYRGAPRASLVPIGAFGALDEKAGLPFKLDVEMAKRLLVLAGYPNGFQRKLILSANTPNPDLAQHVQANATRAGLKIELEQMADANLFTKMRGREFEVGLIGWGAGYPDAHSMISRHAINPDNRAEAKLAQYPSWRSAWADDKINKMAEAAMMERDPAKRIAAYKEIQENMLANGPMAYMFQTIRPIAIRKEVKNFAIGPFKVDYASATK
ncbi:MAG: ABC transporter substrate-binding protein [Alphaproteobacteria bacterium]|nr:ABC transporter substrate-binding protein [Alphaproteobacteria bacterium]